MKIEQQATEYRPITIVLVPGEMVCNLSQCLCLLLGLQDLGASHAKLLTKISNAFSNDLVLP